LSAPDVLALDFDGVLCDGRPEYFEASARTYAHFWSPSTLRVPGLRERFAALRPVIMSGWEMPTLLRALVLGASDRKVLAAWPAVRDATLGATAGERARLIERIREVMDAVRRDWIWLDRDGWLDANRPYAPLDRVRAVVNAVPHSAVVTTKEGEFARLILARWKVEVADVQGKETGEHKCENLLGLMDRHAAGGAPPRVWFVEDRLETLEHVVRCSANEPRLRDVGLFLAAWGYTTPRARTIARRHPRIRLLTLARFLDPATWDASPRPTG